MLRPADFDTEKIRVINHWREKVMRPIEESNSSVNRAYLIAATIICELCVKDVYEQVLPLFSCLKNEDTQRYLAQLASIHDIIFLNKQLSNLTEGEYYFPPLCDELDGREMESILYNNIDLNLDKERITTTVDAYISYHDEFLEDYDNRFYKLKNSMNA